MRPAFSESGSAGAPFVLFDDVGAAGVLNGVIRLSLEAGRLLPGPEGVVVDRVVVAHLRMSVPAARALKRAAESAVGLAVTAAGGGGAPAAGAAAAATRPAAAKRAKAAAKEGGAAEGAPKERGARDAAPAMSVSGSERAPFIYVEEVNSAGHANGVIRLSLEATRMFPEPGGKVLVDRVITAHLRMSVPAARALGRAVDSALLLAAPAESEAKN
jgi:hypothetical protein